jgi:hypothetical protein
MVMKQTEILTGLITFEQVKQAVESSYSEFLEDIDDGN